MAAGPEDNVVAFRPRARPSPSQDEPSPIERVSLLRCRLCGAGCGAEGAVLVVAADEGPVLAWCSPVCAGRHGVWPWNRAFPAVRGGSVHGVAGRRRR